MRSSSLWHLRRPKKSGLAAEWIKSGFYPPNNTADKCPQPIEFNIPRPPAKEIRKPLVDFNGPGCHAKCIGKIGMILCIVF